VEAPHQPETLQVEIPLDLLGEMQALVVAGWFRDEVVSFLTAASKLR